MPQCLNEIQTVLLSYSRRIDATKLEQHEREIPYFMSVHMKMQLPNSCYGMHKNTLKHCQFYIHDISFSIEYSGFYS